MLLQVDYENANISIIIDLERIGPVRRGAAASLE
jgi:hypothetical protein